MTYLDDLLAATRARVAEARAKVTDDALEQRIASRPPARPFRAALQGPGVAIVAEIKRSSPAKGALKENLDAAATARAYAEGGAAAVSVLTEPDLFHGSLEDLGAALTAGLPVLRKDFILDPFQVYESRAEGADAVLLIVRTVGEELDGLVRAVRSLGMDALVEVHDEDDLERAIAAGADLIGINHRDLATFEVDPDRTAKLAPRTPEEVVVVALSGVTTRAEVEMLGDSGADAVLVGEVLVTSQDPAAELRALRGAS